jgi:hypothetical protein
MGHILHSKQAIKIVLQDVLSNYIRSININQISSTTNVGLLNSQYQKEVEVKSEFPLIFNGVGNKFLVLNRGLDYVRENIFQKEITALFEAKIFSQIKNPKKALHFCNLFLTEHPLTQEILIEKSQNEIIVGELRDALTSIDLWNKSSISVYSLLGNATNNNVPIFIFSPTTKCAIYSFKNQFYLVPLSEKYYEVKVIFGNMVLIPNSRLYFLLIRIWKKLKRNSLLRLAYKVSKYILRITYRFLIKLSFRKNISLKNGVMTRKNYLHTYLFFPLLKKLNILLRFSLKHLFSINLLKPYTNFDEALMDVKLNFSGK